LEKAQKTKRQTLYLTNPNLLKFAFSQLKFTYKYMLCTHSALPPQEGINSKPFLEFVTYDRKMPKFLEFVTYDKKMPKFLFKNTHINKST